MTTWKRIPFQKNVSHWELSSKDHCQIRNSLKRSCPWWCESSIFLFLFYDSSKTPPTSSFVTELDLLHTILMETRWTLRLPRLAVLKAIPKNPHQLAFEYGSSRGVDAFKASTTISATPHPVQMLPTRIPPSLEAPSNRCFMLALSSGFSMKKSTNSWTFRGTGSANGPKQYRNICYVIVSSFLQKLHQKNQ